MPLRTHLSTFGAALLLGLVLLFSACGGGGGGGEEGDGGGPGPAEQWHLDLSEGTRGTCDLSLTLRRDGTVRADGTLLVRMTEGGRLDRYDVTDAAVTVDRPAEEVRVRADDLGFSGGSELPPPDSRIITFSCRWSLAELTGYFDVNESNTFRLGLRARLEGGSGITDEP